jgi:ribosomal protein L11 methyltransferase
MNGSTAPRRWCKFVFSKTAQAEHDLSPLAELTSGLEELGDGTISTYTPELSQQEEDLLSCAHALGLKLESRTSFLEENWVLKHEELLVPTKRGSVTITPVSSPLPEHASQSKDTIVIVPGMGFGTGHHATTGMLTELLCSLHHQGTLTSTALREHRSLRALDLGTGSGILALVYTALTEGTIEAIDIDPDALENAKDNLSLNPLLQDAVTLRVGTVQQAQHASYDIIIANLYAELLHELASEILARCAPRALLLLSGILATRAHLIEEAYGTTCSVIEKREEHGWCAYVLCKE